MYLSISATSFSIAGTPISLLSPSSAFSAEPVMIGVCRRGTRTSSAAHALHLDQLEQLGVVHHVGLVQEHHDVRHATWRASRMCSRVCGIGPSAADTPGSPVHLRRPVIMFFT
jgi:hypothetical protein